MTLSIIPNGSPVGAELCGIDLARDIATETVEQIKGALDEYGMLFVRRQYLTPAQQAALSGWFGRPQDYDPMGAFRIADHPEIVILSNIYENDKPVGVIEAGQYWHTDLSYLATPPSYAILQAVEIPRDASGKSVGGTIFTNTARAYESLPPPVKARIQSLRAIHSREGRQFSDDRARNTSEYDAPNQRMEQPVVRSHPRTGRKCLYVNQTYTERLVGMDEQEGQALLEFLYQHATAENQRYIHRWDDGDLLIWDDCMVQHFAISDYQLPQRRRMHRTSIAGPRPA